VLFNGASIGSLQLAFGRAKPTNFKAKFAGVADVTRTAGQQVGVLVKQLLAPTGVLPTARNYTPSQIQQGPANLWIVPTPPTDIAQRLTLAADLTPDATTHPSSVGLGLTESAITLTLTPKMEALKVDQFDAPVAYYCTALDSKIEATFGQAGFDKLTYALGLGSASYQIDVRRDRGTGAVRGGGNRA
jgi:hypothetical protein